MVKTVLDVSYQAWLQEGGVMRKGFLRRNK